jgi:uncharacterized protein YeaO (DUF488 family)
MIKTKRIYDPPEPSDGHRLLVMRRWPRGIKKTAVDGWNPDLGPSLALLREYRQGKVDWPTMAQRYRREMQGRREELAEVARLAREGDVTLLCSCQDEKRCHRTLLKELVEGLS